MENFTELHSICLKVFEEVTKAVSVFILPLFLGRIVFANIVGEGQKALETFKGVVIYFLLIAGFPFLLDILFSIPENFLPKWQTGKIAFETEFNKSTLSSVLPFSLDTIMETILSLLYWVAYYLHIFFMILMSSMAPVVFLTGGILGIGIGIEIFMGLIVIGSCWPLVWFGFDQVHIALSRVTTDPFATKCLELMITTFKGLAPLTLSSLAIKSPAGQMIMKSTKAFATTTNIAAQLPAHLIRSSNVQNQYQNYNSKSPSTRQSGLRKFEKPDFERVLGDRFKRSKDRGEK